VALVVACGGSGPMAGRRSSKPNRGSRQASWKAEVRRRVVVVFACAGAAPGGTADDAFEQLQRISQSENTKLAVVAQRVVDETVRRAQNRHSSPSGGA
jgi:hypothetical protein